jgi:phospholipase C
VSIIAPYDSISGHPGYAWTSFDELVAGVIDRAGNPALWKNTAILITFDEGGGYYDSGYVQAMTSFGDGTHPADCGVAMGEKGRGRSTYYDHASIAKFIERNWSLPPLSARSRDNLPNPCMARPIPYVPLNRPR